MTKISIITATYNSALTVKDTLNSIIGQDQTDYECVVVDGGSTDGTVDIIREYEERFGGRMKWISEPDKGIYDAMNKGLRMATGDVVGILNSDDFFSSTDILSTVARGIEGVDAVYGDVHFVKPDNLQKCVRYYSSKAFRPWMMRLGFMPAHPSFYCRREVYEKYGIFDSSFRIAADFELLLRLIFVNRISTRYICKDFVTMRTGGASTSGLYSHRRILSEHFRAYRQNNVHSNLLLEGLRYVYKSFNLMSDRLKLNTHHSSYAK